MPYIPITDSQIDADSPLLSASLGHRLRDNPEAMHAGEVGAPKFLFPPGRGTASGLLRPDGIGGVRVGPYGAGLPPTLIISSGTFVIPRGVYRIIVEAWGAGRDVNANPTGGDYGRWGRSIFPVTPGEVLSVTVGTTSGQSTSVTGAFGTMTVTGGGGGAGVNTQESSTSPVRSGGLQRIGLGDDGPRAHGGNFSPGPGFARGAVLIRGVP